MKLHVLIPSRGRPFQLAAALYSLFFCESGKHDVTYCVAVDEDDEPTRQALQDLRRGLALNVRIGPRPETLGSVANDLALHWPADVYQVFGDDLMCITNEWDVKIAEAFERTPHGVFWMRSAKEQDSLVPAVTEKWRAAAGGIFTEHFPFWFDDMWLLETWVMATDADPIFIDNLVVDRPHSTHRMRDLRFWSQFYYAMRPERVRHGRQIAAALGLPEPVVGPEFGHRMNRHAPPISMEKAQLVEASNQAETGTPNETYLRIKARAEELMKKAA